MPNTKRSKRQRDNGDTIKLRGEQAAELARAAAQTIDEARRARYKGSGVRMGIVTQTGEFVRAAHHGLRVLDKNAEREYQRVAYKSPTQTEAGEREAAAEPTELHEADDPFNYDRDGVISPPFPYETLAALMTTSVVHATAIETKASDYSANGYELTPEPGVEGMIPDDVLDAARAEVEAFLNSIADGKPIDDLVHDDAIDWESLGSCGFEVRRTKLALAAAANHVPFKTVRVLNSKTQEDTGCLFLQRRFNKRVYFLKFGDAVKYADPAFDPFTAEIDEFPPYHERTTFMTLRDDLPLAYGKSAKDKRVANEFFFLARPPLTMSQIYGTPAGVTALQSMLAQLRIDAYNLAFFASKGVPAYAVILSGLEPPAAAAIDDAEGDDEAEHLDPIAQLEAEIMEFFSTKLIKSDRSVAVFTTFGEAEIRFEKLQSDNAEAAFERYEKRVTEMVRLAHRVPGAAMGILETANLGSGRDVAQLRRYRDHIVSRGQREFENAVNQLIRVGLLIPYFRFKFKPLEIEEEQAQRDFLLKEFINGAIALDDYLEATGRAPIGDERGGNLHVVRTSNVTYLNQDGASALNAAIIAQKQARQLELAIGRAVADVMEIGPDAGVEDDT